MAKSGLLTGSRTIYNKSNGNSLGTWDIQYYDLNDDLSIGVAWDVTSNATQVSAAPGIIRWDSSGTDNYGGTFDETLSAPSGGGSWYDISWHSPNASSGWSGWYDTFTRRTWNRTHAKQTVTLTISSSWLWSYGCGDYGSDTSKFTLTIDPLASYTVSYNKNTTDSVSNLPSSQKKWYGESLTLSSTTPTRTGYIFSGWNTKSDGTGTNYSAGGSYTGNSALTLYAKWTAAKVTVNYHINSGTLTAQTTAGATATVYRHSSSIVQYYSPAATTPAWTTLGTTVTSTSTYANLYNVGTFPIVKTGYHIVATQAWNSKADGTGSNFNQDDTATNTVNKVTTTRLNGGEQISSNVTKTLYVNWKINTYTVSYNANGGTANTTPTAQTKTHGVTLTLSSTKPTKANVTGNVTVTFNYNGSGATSTSATSVKSTTQTFSSWNTKSNGTGTAYASGATFSQNGSSHGDTITLYAKWADGTTTYSSIKLPTGTWSNHTLLGWYTVSATTGGTKRGDPDTNYTPTGNETMYARWGYNVTYNANSGTTTPTAQVKTPGTALTLRAAITRNKTTGTHTIAFNPNGGSVSPTSTTATKTISYTFANWKATDNTTYAASGSYTKDEPTTMTAQWTSTTTTAAVTLPTPTWTGRVVDGWYTDTSWTTKRGNAGVNYTPTQSETLYARWKRSITYNKNTTATVTNLPSTQTAYTDTDIQISNTTPSWTNHNFYKWNTAADGSGTWYNPGQLYSDTNSLDLYAIWKYTITYNANGGTTTPAAHIGIVGQNIKIADEPIYEGYKFTAWTTNADGTGTAYDKGQIYTGQQNLVLYAKWTKINTVEDIQTTDVSGGNRFIPASLISNIWNKIAPYFYGKTLYEFNNTIDWNTIRTTPTSSDLNITLSEACYNYKRLIVIGRTYHNTYVSTVILNPQRNKQFNLNDNFAYHNLNLTTQEPFSLYMRQVPWTISSDGTKIEQQGIYGQRYLRESTQTTGWNNNFNIKIIKVIGYKN